MIASQLACWHTQHRQTELFICADKRLESLSASAVNKLRSLLDDYIAANPVFAASFEPTTPETGAPDVVRAMCAAGQAAGVGPMAAVAGAFAAHVGQTLLSKCREVIVENGGDVYLKTETVKTVAIFAGQSPLSMKIGVELDARAHPLAICTSAGTVGPSVSFGNADAAVVISRDACLADACATRLGNEIKTAADIGGALEMITHISGVIGAIAVIGKSCGAAGQIQLKAL